MTDKNQTFAEGFILGWQSVLVTGFPFPEIPPSSVDGSGSNYIRGLIEGIEAAKKQLAKSNSQIRV